MRVFYLGKHLTQANRNNLTENKISTVKLPIMSKGTREVVLLLTLFLGVYLMTTLITFSPSDHPFNYSSEENTAIHNAGGKVGAWIGGVLLLFIGYIAFVIPFVLAYIGWLLFRMDGSEKSTTWRSLATRIAGFIIMIIAGTGLADVHFAIEPGSFLMVSSRDMLGAGGVVGYHLRQQFTSFGDLGATLILLAFFLAGLTFLTNLSWLALVDVTGKATYNFLASFGVIFDKMREKRINTKARKRRAKIIRAEHKREKARIASQRIINQRPSSPLETSRRAERDRQVPLFDMPATEDLPPLSLLDPPLPSEHGYSEEALEAMSRQVELKLKDFGIQATVEGVSPGPVITMFELDLAPGVKVSQVSNLAKDLARALSAISVRVVEVIPGKSVIGLEVPNENRELIQLSEILQSDAYDESRSYLTMGLGKDISGNPVVADLIKMPHLLIAGTTGSGKSVAINAMVLSLLFKASPQDVRLIMIDPKMLELAVYEGIPHLLTPVVTDMKDAANALRWCVGEMERRYKLMAALGVRNISGYNRKVKEAIKNGEAIADPLYEPEADASDEDIPTLSHLPYIVVIIDELADMMMMVGKKVEELIARLAQKARAAGVHLILATQRPSVNVITGLIKANIPTRIAFQVSARVDSRTILDQMGAEQLLGHGDMLFLSPGSGVPTRVHGAFVSDQEVHRAVAYLKEISEPNYIDEITEEQLDETALLPSELMAKTLELEADPLYDEAVFIVTQSRRASISSVQRRLKIGYNRAARIMEAMEKAGIVSEMQSNGSREVLAPPPPETEP